MVNIEDPHDELPQKRAEQLKELALTVLNYENKQNNDINLILVDRDEITDLNKKFLNRSGPTDVIAFPFDHDQLEPNFLGEVYICADIAREQAPSWQNTYEEELERLVVHGILHLIGFDHLSEIDEQKMHSKEDEYLKRYRRL